MQALVEDEEEAEEEEKDDEVPQTCGLGERRHFESSRETDRSFPFR